MLGIIIPAYNRPQKLREALSSLITQTFKRFFVCVVDDASTEDLKSVCDEFQSLNLNYIRLDKNGGPGPARQRGLEWAYACNLDLVMFLDSDDLLFPNAVQALTYEINHSKKDFIKSQICVESQITSHDYIPADMSTTWLHGTIYRTQFLKNKNIRFSNLSSNEDLAFNLKVTWSTTNGGSIDQELYLWRSDSESYTQRKEISLYCQGQDFIEAIYEAWDFVKNDPNFKVDWCIANILACYNFYQISVCRNVPTKPEVEQKLKEMLSYPAVQEKMSNPKIMNKFKKVLHQYETNDDNILFFKETFYDWYTRFGGQ